jgi:hypothetical protein
MQKFEEFDVNNHGVLRRTVRSFPPRFHRACLPFWSVPFVLSTSVLTLLSFCPPHTQQEIEQFSVSESVTGAAQEDRIRSMDENPNAPFDLRSTLVDAVGAGAGMLGLSGVAAGVVAYNRRQSTRAAGAPQAGVSGNAATTAGANGAPQGKAKRTSAGSVNGDVVSPFVSPVDDIATSYPDNL